MFERLRALVYPENISEVSSRAIITTKYSLAENNQLIDSFWIKFIKKKEKKRISKIFGLRAFTYHLYV